MTTVGDELLEIPIRDNGEPLVNPVEICAGRVLAGIHPTSRDLQGLDRDECYLREGAARRLCRAAGSLPPGLGLKIWEAHRPTEVQEIMFSRHLDDVRRENPDLSRAEQIELASRFVARPEDVPPHLCGGTVDLTLVDDRGRELDMGTGYLTFDERTPTESDVVTPEARRNRGLLARAMSGAGFVNYELEWWHWSYGDRYWAYKLEKTASIYGAI